MKCSFTNAISHLSKLYGYLTQTSYIVFVGNLQLGLQAELV